MIKTIITIGLTIGLAFSVNAQEKYSGKMVGVSAKTYFTFSDDMVIVEAKGKYKSIDTLKVVKRTVRNVDVYNVTEGALHPTRYTVYNKLPYTSYTMLEFAQRDDLTKVVTVFNYRLTKINE